jgi:hypothetical protein
MDRKTKKGREAPFLFPDINAAGLIAAREFDCLARCD